MQELAGRLKALDPEASETLRVISYFDALTAGHASAEVLLRGASMLAGCPAGFTSPALTLRVDERGRRSPEAGTPAFWPTRAVTGGGTVWIERDGNAHANDDMILERVALALGILFERTGPAESVHNPVETLLDSTESAESRQAAAHALHLVATTRYRVITQPASTMNAAAGPSAVITTVAGAVRAEIVLSTDAVAAPRAGIGIAASPSDLIRSWLSALTALRLTSDHEPVLYGDDLGSLLLLAEISPAGAPENCDLQSLGVVIRETPRILPMLDTLAASESLRAAAATLGFHHSTVQSRAEELSAKLGFDVRTSRGRTRLSVALALHRLETARFD
ncbi:helix-turn-helix domain-containing protein [Salinibacterium sp. NSLL150]|uniref:helix-turn-helix domain-containing protein n=1 Tax=unclassified Salinibacterium TaxID=2632331 RepID=UPI0018CD18C8|nr:MULTISPECIES: helix-turn-helix domain-containing protein [unclassified Salinibacterium]MBH0100101.1 helix-turn-helix domain-containing protein [Salinibacterium sp. NSLL35]MBH0102855.1 helix-turn-helix domain-containing protein [Salinibacterium sp. NSLL150]MBH0105615.1 helix-turn-helix domain-containing protein [Salinibacterium sp. NSLL16]MBH0108375.1 helix-turn-helix domain-containing protein [Salinibacterium sp. NSLL17]